MQNLRQKHRKETLEKIGFRGILKKVMILLIVILAQMIGTAAGIEEVRDLVVGFYIANEGISVLENAGRMNVPVCKNFTKYLEQLKDEEKT